MSGADIKGYNSSLPVSWFVSPTVAAIVLVVLSYAEKKNNFRLFFLCGSDGALLPSSGEKQDKIFIHKTLRVFGFEKGVIFLL